MSWRGECSVTSRSAHFSHRLPLTRLARRRSFGGISAHAQSTHSHVAAASLIDTTANVRSDGVSTACTDEFLSRRRSQYNSHFQQYYTSDYLHRLRRKQTAIHLPTPPENVTTLTCEMQNFFNSIRRGQ